MDALAAGVPQGRLYNVRSTDAEVAELVTLKAFSLAVSVMSNLPSGRVRSAKNEAFLVVCFSVSAGKPFTLNTKFSATVVPNSVYPEVLHCH